MTIITTAVVAARKTPIIPTIIVMEPLSEFCEEGVGDGELLPLVNDGNEILVSADESVTELLS